MKTVCDYDLTKMQQESERILYMRDRAVCVRFGYLYSDNIKPTVNIGYFFLQHIDLCKFTQFLLLSAVDEKKRLTEVFSLVGLYFYENKITVFFGYNINFAECRVAKIPLNYQIAVVFEELRGDGLTPVPGLFVV